MNPEIKSLWLAALRSGEYRQGQHDLLDSDGNACCLGVLCLIQGCSPGRIAGEALSTVFEEFNAGLDRSAQQKLAAKNDDGETFLQIADYIEGNL